MKETFKKFGVKVLAALLISFTIALVLPQPEAVHAAPLEFSGMEEEISKVTAVLLNLQKALNTLLWPVLVIIGGLMENNFLFNNGMDIRIREIWVPIRNIVNIFFVIVLVGIALYNVLGFAEDNYTIKSILPKIIVGIIAVNFSFLAMRVFLDVINVLTVSIFALPDNVSEGMASTEIPLKNEIEIAKICSALQGQSLDNFQGKTNEEIENELRLGFAKSLGKKYGVDAATLSAINSADQIDQIRDAIEGQENKDRFQQQMDNYNSTKLCNGLELSENGQLFFLKWESRNAALAMAINMGRIIVYEDADITEDLKISTFLVQVLVSLILYLTFAVSFLALLAVLVARVVVCWIAIALSPVLILALAVPVVKEKISALGKILDEFVALAIAPIPIALSMTVGWIMMKSIQYTTSSELTSSMATTIPALSTTQDLIIAVAAIAIIWVGVFTSADNTIARSITEPLGDVVKGAGAWIATSPRYANIIPTVDDAGNIVMTDFNTLHQDISDLRDKANGRYGGGGNARRGLKEQRDIQDMAAWIDYNEREGDEYFQDQFQDWRRRRTDVKRSASSGDEEDLYNLMDNYSREGSESRRGRILEDMKDKAARIAQSNRSARRSSRRSTGSGTAGAAPIRIEDAIKPHEKISYTQDVVTSTAVDGNKLEDSLKNMQSELDGKKITEEDIQYVFGNTDAPRVITEIKGNKSKYSAYTDIS